MAYWVLGRLPDGATAVTAFSVEDAVEQAKALGERGAEAVEITDEWHTPLTIEQLERIRTPDEPKTKA